MTPPSSAVVPEPAADGSLPAATSGLEHGPTARQVLETAPASSEQSPRPMNAPERSKFLALFTAVMLPMFLAAVDQTLLTTATPRIASELGGLSSTAWIVVGYLLAATITAPLYGRMGDRHGRRGALLAALGVFAAGSLGCGLATSLWTLVAARVLQGLGGGGLMVLSQALIGELVEPRLRPRYQGYFAIVFTASSIGGPLVGGLTVNHASWRWLFLANLPLCLLAAWRVAKLPRAERSPHRDAPYDPMGVLLFAGCACSTLLWVSFVGHRFAFASSASAGFAAVGIGCGTLLWHQQKRHPHPFLPFDLMRLPGVPWICASVAAFSSTMFALVFLMPIYLQAGHRADAASAGVQLLPLTTGIVIGSWVNGKITTLSGTTGRLPSIGLGVTSLGLLTMALSPPSSWLTSVVMALCGLGLGTVMPHAQIAAQMLAGRHRLGAASALLSLTRSSGASFGTAAFGGLVFTLLQMNAGLPGAEGAAVSLGGLAAEEVTHAFHWVFGTVAACAALGAWAASRMPVMNLSSGPDTSDMPAQ